MNKKSWLVHGLALSLIFLGQPVVTAANEQAATIVIDGDLSEWQFVSEQSSQNASVQKWQAVYSKDHQTLYMAYRGMASSQWDFSYLRNNSLLIQYADASVKNGRNEKVIFAMQQDCSVKDGYYGDVAGAMIKTINGAHGNTPGPYTVEAAIPASFFGSQDFTLTFAQQTISSGEIEDISELAAPEEEEAVYNGITIDGSFDDWRAVSKVAVQCPNAGHPDCVSQAAMVFDGKEVAVYLKEGQNGQAWGAGTHSNGKYSITSDLGYEVLFQLMQDGTVSGIEGAKAKHVGSEWEIAIPSSALPHYKETISFGLYQSEPMVKDVADLQEDDAHKKEENEEIAYDGLYGDWKNYPHTTISYATAGTTDEHVDGSAALFCDQDKLYGHVETKMQAHLNEGGGEFTQAVTLDFGNGRVFYPRVAAVDGAGNMNWSPKRQNLGEGSYEFYLFSTDAWATSANINALNAADVCYGKMNILIAGTENHCEYYIDLEKAAHKFNCNVTDFKMISAQYGRIGSQWVHTAGASSGAYAGVGLCCLITGLILWRRKKMGGLLQ